MTDLNEKALKPCPFCGNHTKPKVMDWDGDGFPGYEVRCDASGWEGLDDRGCGAAGGWGETPDEAVAAWNRRTLSTITPAEAGRLVEALAAWDKYDPLISNEKVMRQANDVIEASRSLLTALTTERAVKRSAWGEWERAHQEKECGA